MTTNRKRAEGVVRARKSRLKKIEAAQLDLESALLTLRNHFKVRWTNQCFRNLYYLTNLARKAP